MSNARRIIVLLVTTWAFIVSFAVWMMFGVIGIPIRDGLGLDTFQFGLLTATPVLTGSLFRLPLGDPGPTGSADGSSCSCCW